MDRLLLVLGGVAIALLVASLLSRRKHPAPAANTHTIPRQLDRNDFHGTDRRWLVAVFTASSCATCAGVMERAKHLAGSQVCVQELELGAEAALHERYGIDAVPMLLIADQTGAVRRAFAGPTTAADLWASLADLREPRSREPHSVANEHDSDETVPGGD